MKFGSKHSKQVKVSGKSGLYDSVKVIEHLNVLLNNIQDEYQDYTSKIWEPQKLDYNIPYDSHNIDYCSTRMIANACDSIVIRKSKEHPEYEGIVDISIAVKENKFNFKVDDNGMGVNHLIEQYLFKDSIRDYILDLLLNSSKDEKALEEVNQVSKLRIQDILNVDLAGGSNSDLCYIKRSIKKLGGEVGYFNKGEFKGAVFWYEIPLKSISVEL